MKCPKKKAGLFTNGFRNCYESNPIGVKLCGFRRCICKNGTVTKEVLEVELKDAHQYEIDCTLERIKLLDEYKEKRIKEGIK